MEDELEGEVDCEEELEGDVALWLVELLGDVLCELLDAEGGVVLWSDCGIAEELELLLDGLLEGELLAAGLVD